MKIDDLTSIIRLSGIKRNIAEDGMSPPPLDNPGELTTSDGTPVKDSSGVPIKTGTASAAAPANNAAPAQQRITRSLGNGEGNVIRDPGINPKISIDRNVPELKDVTKLTNYKGRVVAVTDTGEIRGIWDGLHNDWQVGEDIPQGYSNIEDVSRTVSIDNAGGGSPIIASTQISGSSSNVVPTGSETTPNNNDNAAPPAPPSAVAPTGSAALNPAQNPDLATNIPSGQSAGGAGTVPKKPAKTLLPVDDNVKEVQKILKDEGYDLGPTGIDGRMGRYTQQALDDFRAGKPPSKTSTVGGSGAAPVQGTKTVTSSSASAPAASNPQLLALKQQAERQRKSGDEAAARATERAMAQISTPPSQTPAATSTGRGAGFTDPRIVKPGEPPPTNGTAAPAVAAQDFEEALARLEKRAGFRPTNENFNKLTPVEQIQKIRHMVDLTEKRDALGWSTEPAPIINTDVRAPGPTAANAASTAGKAGKAQLAKAALGSTLKKIAPGVGAYDAYARGKEGDWVGAGIAGVGTIASFFPGVGTAISLGLDAVNIGRDYAAGKFDSTEVSPQERAQIEQDWKTLEPYYKDAALFKSLSAKDQARLTRLKQKAAEVAATEKK